MNLKSLFAKFITNKYVLNIVTLFALSNVIGYIVMGHYNNVAYFIALALLTTFFSKNMIIVLGVPLILVNLAVVKNNLLTEGMENNTGSSSTTTDTSQSVQSSPTDDKPVHKNNKQDAKSKQGLPITPLDHINDVNTDESFEVGRGKKKGNDIDYAATVEDAYDQLNQILGSDGIKRLTDDTQNLMKQQMELAKSMESMAPMIQSMAPMMKQAQDLLGGMNDSNGNLGGIMDIAKKLSGGMGSIAPKN
jgi:hypothetical protein